VMNSHGDHHGHMNGHTVMLNQNTSPPQHGVMSPSLTSGWSLVKVLIMVIVTIKDIIR
jgi:hypothetical protein